MLVQGLWLLTWPVLIIISYQLIKFAVKRYEKITTENEND